MTEERKPRPDLEPWTPVVFRVGWAVVAAVAIVNIFNAYAIIAGPTEGERYWFLMDGGESNPNTWLSVVLLSWTALLAGVCWMVDSRLREPFWAVTTLALLAMSFDDAAQVHERVGGNLDSTFGEADDLSYLWIVPWVLVALVVLVVLWRLRPRLPRRTLIGLLAGAGTFVGAAVILEVVATMTVNKGGTSVTTRLLLYTLEENLELVGTLVIAGTLARHALAVNRRPESPDGEVAV